MLRRGGDDGGGEGLTVDGDAIFGFRDLPDACTQADLRAVRLQPLSGRFREQLAEIDPREEEVSVFTMRTAQTVAQYVGEQLRRGAFRRQVQRGEAKRFPEVAAQGAGLAGGVQPFGDGHFAGQFEASALDAVHPERRFQLFTEADAVGGQQAPGDIERGGHARQGEAKARIVDDLQWPAVEEFVGIGTDPAHQRQCVAVGPEQDVLAVVELAAIDLDAPSPAAEYAAGFEEGDLGAACRQLDRGGKASPAATDDGDFQGFSP